MTLLRLRSHIVTARRYFLRGAICGSLFTSVLALTPAHAQLFEAVSNDNGIGLDLPGGLGVWPPYFNSCHAMSQAALLACGQAMMQPGGLVVAPGCPAGTATLEGTAVGPSSHRTHVIFRGKAPACGLRGTVDSLFGGMVAVNPTCDSGRAYDPDVIDCAVVPPECDPATGFVGCLSKQRPGASCDQLRGNPCSVTTGAKTQREEDYSAPSGLAFIRTYDSLANADFGLGRGWTSNVRKRIEVGAGSRRARRSDGTREFFTPTSSGGLKPPSDSQLSLSQDSTGYTLMLRDGSTERYNLAGVIASDTNRAGQVTTYAYNGSGQLETVTGPFGHTLTFTYSSGHLATLTDSAAKTITYGYTSNRLTTVTYHDQSRRIYHYDNSTLPNLLTGISNREVDTTTTRYATFAYGTNGKAESTEHAGGIEHFSFDYDSATQTTVTDAESNEEVVTFASNQGVNNVTSRVFGSTGKSVVQAFNSNNGLLCRKDEEGRITTHGYNSSNQRTSTTEGLIGSCSSTTSTSETRTT
jgi:YD repeat-containing protein